MKVAVIISALSLAAFASAAPAADKRQSFPSSETVSSTEYNQVTYYGDWVHLTNQGNRGTDGNYAYTGEANAMVQIVTPVGEGITQQVSFNIYSTKKSDRGPFSVYIGSTWVGTGNEYNPGAETQNSEVVFSAQDVTFKGGDKLVIKNDKGAAYLSFDAVYFYGYNEP